jgi:hypothetical protein
MPVTSNDNTASSPPTRPGLALRIGITGTREIPADRDEELRRQLTGVLDLVRQELTCLARMTEVQQVYRLTPNTIITPELRFLSPLAEGADRLAADVALKLKYTLRVPMPFCRNVYRNDFVHADPDPAWDCGSDPLGVSLGDGGASLHAFEDLLTHAGEVLELDGGRGEDENASYEAIGRHVVRNSDLLIAIWDGEPARGRGGTGDIVSFAIRAGVPVWWLRSTGSDPPRLLRTPHELRVNTSAPAGKAAEQALRILLQRAVQPPESPPPPAHTVLSRVVHGACRLLCHQRSPLLDYLQEDLPPPPKRWYNYRNLWRTYTGFMAWIAPDPKACNPTMLPPEGSIESWWHDIYTSANTLSMAYGDRYRSSYLLIFLLAFFAVICTVVATVAAWATLPAIALQLTAFVGIAILVMTAHFRRWHERWISYRLLSELCRKQQALAPLGWSLPNLELDRLAGEGDGLTRDAWVAWYFTAMRRASPLPDGVFTETTLRRARDVGRSLLAEQYGYHRTRRVRSTKAAHWLGERGEWCFIATLAGVVLQLVLLHYYGATWSVLSLVTICALLPAASAAFIGIRAYAEFELLAHQSRRMKSAQMLAMAELKTVQVDRPLASQELGAQLYAVAIMMLQDVSGWAQLFRMKAVETS